MFSNTVQKLTVGTIGIVSSEGISEIIDIFKRLLKREETFI